jgi:hypothetical protein
LDRARWAFPPCVAIVCGYEAVAITSGYWDKHNGRSGRIPTITAIQKKYRILGPMLVGGLIAHFYGEFIEWSKDTEVCGSL